MNLDVTIVELLTAYQLPAIFVGSFFFGETVIITAGFLSAQGYWSLFNVFWLAFLGTIVSDTLWFLFGQQLLTYLHKWDRYQAKTTQLLKKMQQLSGERPFLILLFIKFLYGTRILTIMYLSIRRVGLWTFVLYDSLGSLIWLAVIVPIGWLAGKSIIDLWPYLNRIEYALLLIAVIILVFKLATLWISKKITRE